MKNSLLVFLLLLGTKVNSQTSDDARVINISVLISGNVIGISYDKNYTLHNQVIFNVTNSFAGNVQCKPGGGLPSFSVVQGINPIITFPSSSTWQTVNINFELLSATGTLESTATFAIDLKPTYTVNNAGIQLPTEIWDIGSTATWTPPVSGAFPAGSTYNGSALSGGTAYVKIAPSHGGKLLKPLIFVDGIDFNTNTYTYNGQIIRHGSTGWDVLMLGNDASERNSLDLLDSEFKYYPTALQQFLDEGYDVIFMDFASGADYIQKNGMVLVKLIEMVNERRAADDPDNAESCENAVIGASMEDKWLNGH
jgi:hypothetical protein